MTSCSRLPSMRRGSPSSPEGKGWTTRTGTPSSRKRARPSWKGSPSCASGITARAGRTCFPPTTGWNPRSTSSSATPRHSWTSSCSGARCRKSSSTCRRRCGSTSARGDIDAVLHLAKISKPSTVTLLIAHPWTYDLVKLVKEQLPETRNPGDILKAAMATPLKQHGAHIAKLVPKLVNNPSMLPAAVLSQEQEQHAFAEGSIEG